MSKHPPRTTNEDHLTGPHIRTLLDYIRTAQREKRHLRFPRIPRPSLAHIAGCALPPERSSIDEFCGDPIMLPSDLLDEIAGVIELQHETLERERTEHHRSSHEYRTEIGSLRRELERVKSEQYDAIRRRAQ